jgi:hypothetical protein
MTTYRRAGMENDPFKSEKLLTLGFCLSILPEVVLELVHDTAEWLNG